MFGQKKLLPIVAVVLFWNFVDSGNSGHCECDPKYVTITNESSSLMTVGWTACQELGKDKPSMHDPGAIEVDYYENIPAKEKNKPAHMWHSDNVSYGKKIWIYEAGKGLEDKIINEPVVSEDTIGGASTTQKKVELLIANLNNSVHEFDINLFIIPQVLFP